MLACGRAVASIPTDLYHLPEHLQVFTLVSVAGLTVLVWAYGDEANLQAALLDGILHGTVCVYMAMMVTRRISMFPWGLAMSSAYIAMAWREKLWGQVGMHAYFILIQPWGMREWQRVRDGRGVSAARALNPCARVLALIFWANATTFVLVVLLNDQLLTPPGALTLMDIALTAIGVAAQTMTLRRHAEAFILWIGGNLIGMCMGLHLGLWKVTATWATFFVYSLLGLRAWTDRETADARDPAQQPPAPGVQLVGVASVTSDPS